VHFPQGTDIR